MAADAPEPLDRFTVVFGVAFGFLVWMASDWRPAAAIALIGDCGLAMVVLMLFPRMRRSPSPFVRWFGIAFPLLAFYGLYWQLGLRLTAPNVVWYDATIASLEVPLLWQSPVWTAGPAIGEWFAFAYTAYVPLLIVVAVALFHRGSRGPGAPAERFVRAVCVAWAICYVVAVLFPVMGPRGTLTDVQAARFGSGIISRLTLLNQKHGMLIGAAFPSPHVAATTVALVSLRRVRSPLLWPAIILGANLVVGAVYLGYHYAIDAVAGIAVGLGGVLIDARWVPRLASPGEGVDRV